MTDGGGDDGVAGRAPVASVVIPAHDEEAVIGRLLAALSEGVAPGALDIVVACNGCTDATADVARRAGARVVETDRASKPAALNMGDEAARGFPRAYVDADVTVTGGAIAAVAAALGRPGTECAAPPLRVEVDGRPWPVRAWFAVWERTPYLRDDHVGSGIYAMSEAGRARFDRFPDIIADDLFGRDLFARAERAVVDTEPFVVEAPWTMRALLRRRVRVYAGILEVAERADLPPLPGAAEHVGPWWRAVTERPTLAPAALCYVTLNALAKASARRRLRRREAIDWGRDATTRTAAPGST